MTPESGGRSTGTLPITEMGLYRVSDGTRTALAAAGPLNPIEFADVRTTPEKLAPLVAGERRRRLLGRRRRDPGNPPGLARPRRRRAELDGACAPMATMS